MQQYGWPSDLTLSLAAPAVAACSRVAAVQQHCWPPDLTLPLTAQAVAARYWGAAVQQHCCPHAARDVGCDQPLSIFGGRCPLMREVSHAGLWRLAEQHWLLQVRRHMPSIRSLPVLHSNQRLYIHELLWLLWLHWLQQVSWQIRSQCACIMQPVVHGCVPQRRRLAAASSAQPRRPRCHPRLIALAVVPAAVTPACPHTTPVSPTPK